MNKNEKISYWVNIAEYDLKTAKVMLEGKRYVYVGFMCHQAIEKILKALYTKIKNDTPPFTHNLLFLSEKCSLLKMMDEEKISFLHSLQPLNIESRYPSYKDFLFTKLNYTNTKEILKETKTYFKWIKNML